MIVNVRLLLLPPLINVKKNSKLSTSLEAMV